MTETDALYVIDNTVRLGSITTTGPRDVIENAKIIANDLASIVKDRKLYSTIQGKNFVRVEGWSTMGAMLGIVPREVSVTEAENGDFLAEVELIRAGDGAIIGRASAIVGVDEQTWAKRPRYARRSMALTRATGKAYRLGFSWIMTLAGYEPTPAEEMDGVIEAVTHATPSTPPPPDELRNPYKKFNITLEQASNVLDSEGNKYGDCDQKTLEGKRIGITRKLNIKNLPAEEKDELLYKLEAIDVLLGA